MEPLSVLLVCSGNTCRSPMAEALLKRLLDAGDKVQRPVRVQSAGTGALAGAAATPEAIAVMDERGIDLRGHRARRVTSILAADADLVLTMEARHRQRVLELLPELEGRVFTLKEGARRLGLGGVEQPAGTQRAGGAAGSPPVTSSASGSPPVTSGVPDDDITDPFGRPLEVYRQTAAEIEKNLRALLPALQEWPARERTSKDKGETRDHADSAGK